MSSMTVQGHRPELARLTGREPFLRINYLTDCHVKAKFKRNKQGDQELQYPVSISGGMNETIERVRTSSGHRKRTNIHSCFFSCEPVPLLRLVGDVRTAERFLNYSDRPLDLNIDRSKVRHRRHLAYSRCPCWLRYYRTAWHRRA